MFTCFVVTVHTIFVVAVNDLQSNPSITSPSITSYSLKRHFFFGPLFFLSLSLLKKPLYNVTFITSLRYNVTFLSVPKQFFLLIFNPSITSLFFQHHLRFSQSHQDASIATVIRYQHGFESYFCLFEYLFTFRFMYWH